MTTLCNNLMAGVAVSLLALAPSLARADDGTGCTVLAQAAASGLAARISADDQTIKPPKSVTALTCLDNFFNGVGLNVLTNLLDPTSLLNSVEGKICALATSAWQSTIGSGQCGLTITGFNVGFGGLGGGSFCPKLTFGGGGAAIGSVTTGLSAGSSGMYLTGAGLPPTGYTLPSLSGY